MLHLPGKMFIVVKVVSNACKAFLKFVFPFVRGKGLKFKEGFLTQETKENIASSIISYYVIVSCCICFNDGSRNHVFMH